MTTNYNRARWPYEPQVMGDEQIEAAHAASEVDDDPSERMTLWQTIVWWRPVITPAVGLVLLGLAAVYWSEIAAFMGVS